MYEKHPNQTPSAETKQTDRKKKKKKKIYRIAVLTVP